MNKVYQKIKYVFISTDTFFFLPQIQIPSITLSNINDNNFIYNIINKYFFRIPCIEQSVQSTDWIKVSK